MAQQGSEPKRHWQDIAQEASRERDPDRLLKLFSRLPATLAKFLADDLATASLGLRWPPRVNLRHDALGCDDCVYMMRSAVTIASAIAAS